MKLKDNTYEFAFLNEPWRFPIQEVSMKATVHIKHCNKFYTSEKIFRIEAKRHGGISIEHDINIFLKITKRLFEKVNKFYGNLLFDRNSIDPVNGRMNFTLDEEQPIMKSSKGLYSKLKPRR